MRPSTSQLRSALLVATFSAVSVSVFSLASAPLCSASQLTAPASSHLDYTESGQATWYGLHHEGRRTTSGETFDGSKMTAAHSSLPMGSYVRVTLTGTGRSIVVRVNDREPPHGVRCIDLSRAAASRLGFLSRGVADVTLAQVGSADATELAEAPDDATDLAAAKTSVPRGRRHTRHGHR